MRAQWTRRREENMEAYLTLDQAREHFGLGGTPDNLVVKRVRQTATQGDIIAAAEKLGQPRLLTWTAHQITRSDFTEANPMPEPEPAVCCACKQPLGDCAGDDDLTPSDIANNTWPAGQKFRPVG
jgi:hypothetical protein